MTPPDTRPPSRARTEVDPVRTLLIDNYGLAGERLRITSAQTGSAEGVAGVSLGLSPD